MRVFFAANGDDDLIAVPFVEATGGPPTDFVGKRSTISHQRRTSGDTMILRAQQIFDHAQTERKRRYNQRRGQITSLETDGGDKGDHERLGHAEDRTEWGTSNFGVNSVLATSGIGTASTEHSQSQMATFGEPRFWTF